MQAKSERIVNVVSRLENIRAAESLSWDELRKELGVSKTLLHFVRTGERAVSPKFERKLRALELRCGLRAHETPPAGVKESKGEYRSVDQRLVWLAGVKARWKRRSADRTQIELAVRTLFEKNAQAVIDWLNE